MMNALPKDALLESQAPLVVRRSSTALMRVVPDPRMAFGTETSLCKCLDNIRMSEVERRAAVDALLLGRDIGLALQQLERAIRRWLGRNAEERCVRHASFRRLARKRRGYLPLTRLK
jgi:hypothetical protein